LAAVIATMADNTINKYRTGLSRWRKMYGQVPKDGPNEPMGEAKGIHPGRVVWVWNPDATNEKFERNSLENYEFFWQPENNNPDVISKMFQDGILKLTGEENLAKSWDVIFKHFNEKKLNQEKRIYKRGERFSSKLTRDRQVGYFQGETGKKVWKMDISFRHLNPEGDQKKPEKYDSYRERAVCCA
jgi:hypothetical protein